MFKKVITWLPVVVLLGLALAIFRTNYQPGTYLLGWDSTVPELNLPLNWQRFLFGVWQEYRGLGTQDGMAHTANLGYWFLVQFLAWLMPLPMVRYISQILLHFLGGLGLYWLLRFDLLPSVLRAKKLDPKNYLGRMSVIAGLAALVYQLNLMTIQMFYTPLELFSLHFAILPWGIYSLRRYLQRPKLINLGLLLLVNLAGVAQAHVPTIFIPYAIMLGLILVGEWLSQPRQRLKAVGLAGLVLFAVNAFWGLPYTYSALTKSAEISNAKQNRLGTDSIFYRNFAWGDLHGMATFGGFQLDYRDWYAGENKFDLIMRDWVKVYQTPAYQLITVGISLMSLLGVLAMVWLGVKRRQWSLLALVSAWGFSLLMLGTDIPILRDVTAQLRQIVPLFYQIFRFTFTKFSLLYVCFVSIMFGVFLTVVLCQTSAQKFWRWITGVVAFVTVIGLSFITGPLWSGKFFYPALRIAVPQSYQALFTSLNQQPADHRILTMPIHSLWGWTTSSTDWGYRGSGFIWQIIQQPLVDRSFDPWSKYNETMYLQLSQALYRSDFTSFTRLLTKFQTDEVLFDQSIFHPGGYEKNLFKPEITQLLASPAFGHLLHQPQLDLYRLTANSMDLKPFNPGSITQLSTNYITTYTTRDQAFQDLGDYIQINQTGHNYPLNFLQRDELSPDLVPVNGSQLNFTVANPNQQQLILANFAKTQPVISAAFSLDSKQLSFRLNLPRITSDNQVVYAATPIPVVTTSALGQNLAVLLQNSTLLDLDPSLIKLAPATLNVPTASTLNAAIYRQNTALPMTVDANELDQSCTVPTNQNRTHCWQKTLDLPDSSQSVLVTLAAQFAATAEAPDICFIDLKQPTVCLNQQVFFDTSTTDTFDHARSFFLAKPHQQYALKLVWNRELGDAKFWQQSTLKTYQFENQTSLNIGKMITEFDQSLTQLNHSTPKQISLSFDTATFGIDALHSNRPRTSGAKNCQFAKQGTVTKQVVGTGLEYAISDRASGCETFFLSELDYSQQYLFHASGQVKSGVGIQFLLTNPLTDHTDLDTVTRTGAFNLWSPIYPSYSPPTIQDNLFQLTLDLETFGRETNRTQLDTTGFIPLPLDWLTRIQLAPQTTTPTKYDTQIEEVSKIGTTFYLVKQKTTNGPGLLVLPQSWDAGWLALPDNPDFLSQIKHVSYNGWANAWLIPTGEYQVALIYWPELLVFVGLGILGLTGLGLVVAIWQQKTRSS